MSKVFKVYGPDLTCPETNTKYFKVDNLKVMHDYGKKNDRDIDKIISQTWGLVKIRNHPSMNAVRSVERINLLKCTTYDQLKTSEPNIEKVRRLQEHNLMEQ